LHQHFVGLVAGEQHNDCEAEMKHKVTMRCWGYGALFFIYYIAAKGILL
jgi:hypothetical protein